ncbi:hypothetical protein [Methanobrevibacter sp.]
MKDTAIILIFLLAVLGLIIGVYYSESADSNENAINNEEVVYEDSNGIISITIEPEEKKENLLNRITGLIH